MKHGLDFKAIFEALPVNNLVLSADPDFIMLAVSDAHLHATRSRREECIGRPLFEVFGANPRAPENFGAGVLRASLERVLETGLPDRMAVTRYDIRRPAAEGGGFEARYWSAINLPVYDKHGQMYCIVHKVEDVTEHTLSQEEARARMRFTDERFRAALLAAGTGTFSWHLCDRSLHCDSALEQLLNLAPGETPDNDTRFIALIHPEDQPAVREAFERCATGEDMAVEFRMARPGKAQWLTCRAKIFRDAAGKPTNVAGACTDISARKQAEEALRVSKQRLRALNENLEARVEAEVAERIRTEEALHQAHKMEAVGQLTGGIAHDFNNLLTGIIGSLDLLQRRFHRGEPLDVDRYINAAIGSAQRAGALTQRLLAFSRRQALDLKPVDVNQMVASLEDLLRRTTGENISVETQLAPDLHLACMDVNQLESALINLVINARDAMPHGGRIIVSTANHHPDGFAGPGKQGGHGDYVLLSVSDSGVGMTPEVLAHAFEPFYTTKPIGQGTGLGLSMVYGYIKQAKGYVEIQSQPNRGTRVCLYLPVHKGEVTHPPAEVPVPLEGTGETILVVEDEPVIRSLVVEVLTELGYRTLEASDANEALAITESAQRIDLLVSDVGLPGMNGRQMADIVRQQRPSLKILFATGYAESAAAGSFLGTGMAVITKPFDMESFATRVREMLET